MNQVTVFNPKGNVPAFAREESALELTKALAGGGASGKRISIKGGVFRLIVDGKQIAAIDERYLDVVVVAAAKNISRTFYSGTYDEAAPAAPDCWSADGVKPDSTAHNPQAVSCASCPQNIKGSGQNDSRACRYNQRLAVVLANDIEGDVMQLTLPATSIFGKEENGNYPLQAYARWLQANNIGANMVITRMKFDTNAPTPKLFFKPMRWLEDFEYAVVKKQADTPDAQQAISLTVAQVDKVQPKPPVAEPTFTPPAASAPSAASAHTTAPAAQEEEPPPPAPKRGPGRPRKAQAEAEAPAPEPTVRKATAQNVAPPPADLAAVVGAWGGAADDE